MRLQLLLTVALVLVAADCVCATEERGKITKINIEKRIIEYDSTTSEGPFGTVMQIRVPNDLKIYAQRTTKSGKRERTLIKLDDLKVGDSIIVLIPLIEIEGKKGPVAGPPDGLFRNDDKAK